MCSEDETQAFLYALRTGKTLKVRRKTVVCSNCRGKGVYCAGCSGLGSLFKACDHCGGDTRSSCKTCVGAPPRCQRCDGSGEVPGSFVPKNHPADKYTIAALRKISVNGSFT